MTDALGREGCLKSFLYYRGCFHGTTKSRSKAC